jgi:hypothetical protein
MSALGQKQTLEGLSGMSALPPKADIVRGCDVQKVEDEARVAIHRKD